MKKYSFLICIFLSGSLFLQAQKLRFNKDGALKIVQFTDIHYVPGDQRADTTLLNIQRVLDSEKPDVVILTGDLVTGKPVKQGWDKITGFIIDRKIPFAVTLGNHDDEQGITRGELEKIVTGYPYNINSSTNGQMTGVLNSVLPVYASEKDMQVKALIYCFDSGTYSTINGVGGYGWITTDIIEWYRCQSLRYTLQNNFQPLPALAYFHIPLPEYRLAFNDEKNKRVGVRGENECAPDLNSGMFLAMREMGDIMATFAGHDHVNDYIVNYYGVALAYGQFTGWRTTYVPQMNGVRVVVLKEGKREFDTWLRMMDGSIKNRTTFPLDFKPDPDPKE